MLRMNALSNQKEIETFFSWLEGQIFLELWEITLKFDYPGFELLYMWLSASYLTFGGLNFVMCHT